MKYLLFLITLSANATITLYPDGSDSIGIPTTPYRATCFNRCESVPGFTVRCDIAQRIAQSPGPVDCAAHCRYGKVSADGSTYVQGGMDAPLPSSTTPGLGGVWRVATASWCPLARRKDTGALVYPASHCENYQMMSLGQFGPGDSECWFPDIPEGVEWDYVNPKPIK